MSVSVQDPFMYQCAASGGASADDEPEPDALPVEEPSAVRPDVTEAYDALDRARGQTPD